MKTPHLNNNFNKDYFTDAVFVFGAILGIVYIFLTILNACR